MSTEEAKRREEASRVAYEKFHDHLDVCAWCCEHPFNLCKIGLPLLQAAATSLFPPGGLHEPRS